MSRTEHRFKTEEELVEMLSRRIASDLENAIRTHGKASLIVSGGKTPIPLFKKLSKVPLEWEAVTVGLCDERWISPTHKESNEHLVKQYLLQGRAGEAAFVGMYTEGVETEAAEGLCAEKIKEALYPFDVLLLGMGSDGHTASLFPGNLKLEKAFDLENDALCISIEPQNAPYRRMSLTLHAILSAKHLYLHFEGEEKVAVYNEALNGDDSYKMPIRSVLNQDIKDVEVYYV